MQRNVPAGGGVTVAATVADPVVNGRVEESGAGKLVLVVGALLLLNLVACPFAKVSPELARTGAEA